MIRELVLVYNILKWHNKVFKSLSAEEQDRKNDSEIDEYIEAKEKYIRAKHHKESLKFKMMDEKVDIIISGINLLKYPDFFERVAVKHNINTHRTWKGVHHDVSTK